MSKGEVRNPDGDIRIWVGSHVGDLLALVCLKCGYIDSFYMDRPE